MENDTITEILIVEHGYLREALSKFIRESEIDKALAKEVLNSFIKKERRHVFIEENLIFNFDKSLKIPIIKTLILQHAHMSKIITSIKKSLDKGEDIRELAENLHILLRAHTHLEEEKFYKLLDKELDEALKNKLIKKIKVAFGES